MGLPGALVITIVIILALISQPGNYDTKLKLPVACIQSEADDPFDLLPLVTETFDGSDKPVFVVMPEHAVIQNVEADDKIILALGKLAAANNAYICVGVHASPSGFADCAFDNVGIVIGPSGKIIWFLTQICAE